ncbi:hypothetical protein BKA56DRAFT_580251 [Ilyonectria sp. MPI-CAGE-AT-0026]|nr:hypothetical protein BKA56DRAFT_580251 [Ilyonectria sp. MPI-CAGE-AT-0026]
MLCCAVRCVVLPPAVFACNPPKRHDERAKPRLFFCCIPFRLAAQRGGGGLRHTRMRRDVFRCGLPSLWSGDDDA